MNRRFGALHVRLNPGGGFAVPSTGGFDAVIAQFSETGREGRGEVHGHCRTAPDAWEHRAKVMRFQASPRRPGIERFACSGRSERPAGQGMGLASERDFDNARRTRVDTMAVRVGKPEAHDAGAGWISIAPRTLWVQTSTCSFPVYRYLTSS